MNDKADTINKICSRLAQLEGQLKQIHTEDEHAAKSEIELLIDTYDTFIVDSSVKELKKLKNCVRMSRDHLRKIIRDCQEAILVIDHRGDIKETNEKIEMFLSARRLDTDRKFRSSISILKTLLQNADINHPAFSTKSFFLSGEERIVPLHVKAANIKSSAGEHSEHLYLFKDISEKKKIEDEIKNVKTILKQRLEKSGKASIIERIQEDFDDNKAQMNSIIESASDGIVTTDAFGCITKANKAFSKLLGYSVHELEGKHWMEFSPLEEKEFHTNYGDTIASEKYIETTMEKMNDLVNREESYFEGFLRRSDGLYVPLWCNLFWIHNKRGERIEGIVIARDLSEKKIAERNLRKALHELQESKDYLENIITNSADAIFLTDASGFITNANKAAERFTGYTHNELLGQHITALQGHYEDVDVEQPRGNFRKRLFGEGTVVGMETVFKSKSGDPLSAEINCSLLEDENNATIGGIVCVRDIRERKRIQAMEIHNAFISNISHELRTPLTLSIGPLEGLLQGECGVIAKQAQAQIELALRNNRLLLKMINQLLELSRLESKSETLSYYRKDINLFIAAIADTFTFLAKKKHISFSLARGKDIPPVYIDPGKMERVFFNIIGNAFKFTPDGGTIEIDISNGRKGKSKDFIQVSVKDTGIGIKETDLPHIFERFMQAESNSSIQHQGTGLGLALAAELVELQGGKIAAESEYGKGSTFTVYIPSGKEHIRDLSHIKEDDVEVLRSQQEVECSDLRHEDATPVEHVPTGERPLILFVDDNPDVRRYVTGILAKQYDVITAADGQEGLEKLQQHLPDLIISDVMMSPMDGYEFCKRVKSNPTLRHIPFIFLTAKADTSFKIESLEEGADDYMVKPFNAQELMARVKCLLRIQELARENLVKEKKVAELTEALGERYEYHKLVGKSSVMQELYRFLEKIKATESPALITGETGTGKELVAHAIQQNSRRKSRPFIVLNCTAIHKNLMESEFFGHVKGAFTGAVANKKGIFESADGGTLFLDEIGEIGLTTQAKLLRVLEEGTFRPVGSANEKRVDVRIIAATNRDLKKMVDKGTFREDLCYRINVISIKVPPLRERKEDIPMLVEHFIKEAGGDKGKEKKFTDKTLSLLIQYDYPGNVRELKNIIESTLALSESTIISSNELPAEVKSGGGRPLPHRRIENEKTLGSARKQAEKGAIMQALNQAKGNKLKAAKLLNVSRTTLYAKIQQYRIKC